MNSRKLTLTALALMTLSTAAMADTSFDQLVKGLADKVTKSVTTQVNRLAGNEAEDKKVTRKVEDEHWQGRFINADGVGYDVKLDLGESGLYRRLALYGDAMNKPVFDLGVWRVAKDGKLVLQNTDGDKTEFNYKDKKLTKSDEPKNVLTKGDFDLFHSRDFIVDIDKAITFRGQALIKNETEDAILTLAGDGTYRMALARGAKAKVLNGMWAQAHDGLIALHDSTGDHYYIAPYKDGYRFSNSEGKDFGLDMFTRDRDFNLFKTYSEGKGTLQKENESSDDLVFVTDMGFTYEVDEKKSELKTIPVGQATEVVFQVEEPASADDLPEISIRPLSE